MIKELVPETRVTLQLLITGVSKGITNKGSSYLSLTLQDASGQIEAKKWDATENDMKILVEGKVFEFEADVLEYKGNNQLKIVNITQINQENIDSSLFVPAAPVSRKIMQDKLFAYINLIQDTQIRSVVEKIVNDYYLDMVIFPAGVKVHHAYASGLLHHTTSMLELAKNISLLYKGINTDYLYAGVILHDIGKTKEFTGVATPKYTLEGKLIGHISIISAIVKETCKELKIDETKAIILQHMVLSHHGEKEKGSPVPPLTIEAEVLNFVDEFDSKMNMLEKALSQIEEGEFTPKIVWLNDRCFLKTPK